MCGICGKLSLAGKPVPEGLIRKMTSVLAHRGPDDEGIYLGAGHPDTSWQLWNLIAFQVWHSRYGKT